MCAETLQGVSLRFLSTPPTWRGLRAELSVRGPVQASLYWGVTRFGGPRSGGENVSFYGDFSVFIWIKSKIIGMCAKTLQGVSLGFLSTPPLGAGSARSCL